MGIAAVRPAWAWLRVSEGVGWLFLIPVLATLVACPSAGGFAGVWEDRGGSCYIHSIHISPAAGAGDREKSEAVTAGSARYLLVLSTSRGTVRVTAVLRAGELCFPLQADIEGRLYLNGPHELRLYRVFSRGAPEEDIDWKFYR